MDTTFIESMIAEHCADANTEPELHDLLAVVAEREGVQVQARDLSMARVSSVAILNRFPTR